MARLADIEGRLASMGTLLDIVAAMRSLAGMRVQEAQRDLPGIRRYAETMAEGIGSVLPFLENGAAETPSWRPKTGRVIVLLCAEHGFAGGFTERVLEAAERLIAPADTVFLLGHRGALMAAERGLRPAWWHAMPTRSSGALEIAHQLSSRIYDCLGHRRAAGVTVLFSHFLHLGKWLVESRSILPLDLDRLRRPGSPTAPVQTPFHYLAPAVLLEQLTAEYVFALLMEAVVESLASENAARFAAMDSATENVKKSLARLRQDANRLRQEEITTELLDVVVGAEAVADGQKSSSPRRSLGQ